MNNKGQMAMVGTLIMVFVGVIVALSIFNGGITSNVATVTTTQSETNATVTLPASGSTVNLEGQAATGVYVTNASNGVEVPSSNYTVENYQIDATTGVITTRLLSNGGNFETVSVNVTYTYEPLGYDTSAGGRSVAGLIIVFSALAVAVFALASVFPGLRDLMSLR